LACLSVSGQWPYFRDKNFAPDIWGDRNIDYIPCLETMGEYESAATWSNEGLKQRQAHPLLPLSMLSLPGQGHFATTAEKNEYLAFYLRKAAHYRLPEETTSGGSVKLRPVEPTKTGWLADKWRKDQAPTAPAAPVGQYTGDPKQAFWYFDEETARYTEAIGAQHRGKKPQLVGFVQDGQLAPQQNTHLQIRLKFQPESDGITFHLVPSFYDTVPGGSGRPANWSGLAAGSAIFHSPDTSKLSIERVIGPVEKVDDTTWRVAFEKTGTGGDRHDMEVDFVATHPGDDKYKPAVQQAQMFIPTRNTKGQDQRINFPAIPDQREGTTSVKLNATSDANVPVSYYVLAGPAQVEGDMLKLTAIPPRAKFPVKVTVVAWQYGRSAEPLLKTAEPVTREFYITKE
jgi:hypothetical protein